MLAGAEHSRGAILDAAQALFIQQGYADTSMRQIAKNAGLALGSTYNHFPAKETIFQTILNERHPYLHLGPLLPSGNFDRKVAQSLTAKLCPVACDEVPEPHPEFFILMLIELVEFKGRHLPELFENLLRGLPSPAP